LAGDLPGTETMIVRTVDVDAWDKSTGVALVVDAQGGARRPVTGYPNFSHQERSDQVVSAVSGGGWRAYWKDEGPDNGPLTEQVLAWLVTSKGRATRSLSMPTGAWTTPRAPIA
jgi:hypothetical protein